MKKPQSSWFITVSVIITAASAVFSGCSGTQVKSSSAREYAGGTVRTPASSEDALIRKFVASIVKESALSSDRAVEDAMTQIVNENADKLSVSKIRSLEDIASLSDAEQKRIINQMIRLPGFSEKLAVNAEAVQVARREAIESLQNTKGVATESVLDIHAQSAAGESEISFSRALDLSPQLKGDVELMIRQNNLIKDKIGVSVLGKGCKDLQAEESVENVATMITGVERDVTSGEAKDTNGVAKSLERNMGDTLGTSKEESHRRVCVLSKSDGCAVFDASMCR